MAANLVGDTDGDGLYDREEQIDLDPNRAGVQNPFDPYHPDTTGDQKSTGSDGLVDAKGDWDGDGIRNAQEFINGTNPISLEVEHFPVRAVWTENRRLDLEWDREPGFEYELQMSTDLKTWSPGVGSIWRTWSPGNPTRYFRVVRRKP